MRSGSKDAVIKSNKQKKVKIADEQHHLDKLKEKTYQRKWEVIKSALDSYNLCQRIRQTVKRLESNQQKLTLL